MAQTAAASRSRRNGRLQSHGLHPSTNAFERFAHTVSLTMGRPWAFLTALTVILIWALSGPMFGFSAGWQLFVNTGTTIATFLMVFLIQQSQNRESMAIQVKLAELIVAVKGADNKLAIAEELSEKELENLHKSYLRLAEHTLAHLEARRGKK
jgi:low affinity Fe/Cu permease